MFYCPNDDLGCPYYDEETSQCGLADPPNECDDYAAAYPDDVDEEEEE